MAVRAFHSIYCEHSNVSNFITLKFIDLKIVFLERISTVPLPVLCFLTGAVSAAIVAICGPAFCFGVILGGLAVYWAISKKSDISEEPETEAAELGFDQVSPNGMEVSRCEPEGTAEILRLLVRNTIGLIRETVNRRLPNEPVQRLIRNISVGEAEPVPEVVLEGISLTQESVCYNGRPISGPGVRVQDAEKPNLQNKKYEVDSLDKVSCLTLRILIFLSVK